MVNGKTRKEMCLEMWSWLAKNPDKNKKDYTKYLIEEGRKKEVGYCWACKEAKAIKEKKKTHMEDQFFHCNFCPIDWSNKKTTIKEGNDRLSCLDPNTEFNNWLKTNNTKLKTTYAKRIVKTIKNTWIDLERR